MHQRHFKLSPLTASMAVLFAPTLYAASAGQVEFATGGVNAVGPNGQSRPLAKGAEVQPGETIDTGTGRAQLRFTDGGYVSLQPQTQFRLEQYGYDKDDPKKNGIVMNLLKGGLRTITGLIGKTNREGYKLQTATATVGIRGTEFSITGFPDGSIVFNVADGAIDVSNQSGSTTVNGGQSISVTSSTAAPTKTEEKPFLPPAVSAEQTKIPVQADAVQQATAPVITPPSNSTPTPPAPPLLTGTQQAQWRVGSLGARSGPSTGYGGSVFTVSPSGHLTSFSSTAQGGGPVMALAFVPNSGSTTTTESQGTTSIRSYGNDGVMAWGTWIDGTSAVSITNSEGTTTGGNTYTQADPLHYVVGVPLANMPTVGTATYSLYGGTAPSCSGPSCGPITITSSLSIDFGRYTGQFNFSMKNDGDGVGLKTADGGINMSVGPDGALWAGSSLESTGTTGVNSSNLQFNGFLAGDKATNAGGIYRVDYNTAAGDTSLMGAAVYKRGDIGPGYESRSFATGSYDFGLSQPYYNQPLVMMDGNKLLSYGIDSFEGGFFETVKSASSVVADGSDAVMSWGRWVGPSSYASAEGTVDRNYSAANPMHYVVGLPLANMPTSGTATYSMYGSTQPSCSGTGCGTIGISSNFTWNFSAQNGVFNLGMTNSNGGVNISGSSGLSWNSAYNVLTANNIHMAGTGPSAYGNFVGFFAGNGATHAGGAISISALSYLVNAGLVFSRGAITGPPP